ncbi:MAG: hypothetical protein FWG45_01310 [Oscillospiraceae bacterium]|nr:hypothetical protein [Oscillospiraceae bacterium]
MVRRESLEGSSNTRSTVSGMKTRLAAKNLLFAEMIIVILFFSVAAAACVTMFAEAQKDSRQARDLTNAVILAQNAAEIFKASDGQELRQFVQDGLIARIEAVEGNVDNDIYEGDLFIEAQIRVHRIADGEVLYELAVAVSPRSQEDLYDIIDYMEVGV